jgi:hypothetical protein
MTRLDQSTVGTVAQRESIQERNKRAVAHSARSRVRNTDCVIPNQMVTGWATLIPGLRRVAA